MKLKQRCLSVLCTLLMLDSFLSVVQASPVVNEKVVSVYLLIDNPAQLQQYVNDLLKLKKPNFNRVVFSFVRPSLIDYQTGNLAKTGILGYFTDHDGKGAQSFDQLKAAIKLSEEKNIQILY